MLPDEIQEAIEKKGYSQRKIAKLLGKSQPAINLIIKGRSKSIKIMQYIADLLDKTFLEVWEIKKSSITPNKKKK